MRLDGQAALVVGASRGLGRAIALALAEEGARVVLAARDDQALKAVAGLIEGFGGEALVVGCDVRQPGAVTYLVEQTLGKLGPIDTLVNSAGAGLQRRVTEISAVEWDDLYASSVRGTLLAIQAVLPTMIGRQRGNIINLVAPLDGVERPGFVAYASANYAVAGLTRTLAEELRPHGVNVNGLHPGGYADTRLARVMLGEPASSETDLLDPAVITPAAVALAAQPPHGLTGAIVDALAWNSGPGLGAGLG